MTSPFSPPSTHQTRQFDDSAIKFLQRLDSLTSTSSIHPLWFSRSNNDRNITLDDVAQEILNPNYINPINPNSRLEHVRGIFDYREELVQKSTDQFENHSWVALKLSLQAFIAILFQVFRPLWLLFFGLIAYVYLPNPSSSLITHLVFTLTAPIFVYLTYTLFTADDTFWCAVSNYQHYIKNGLYTTTNVKNILKNVPLAQDINHTPAKGFLTGDLETLIPGVFYENIYPEIPLKFIRRWFQSPIPGDDEWFGVDITFPEDQNGKLYHNGDKHILVLHHGMGGASHASYLRAVIKRYASLGHTCFALNCRQFGGTFVMGVNLFTGIRISDLWFTAVMAHIGAGNGVIDELILPQLDLLETSPLLDNEKLKKMNIHNFHDYYSKLALYQQILVKKPYSSFIDVFKQDKKSNPIYIPSDQETDIIHYRQSQRYTPVSTLGISMGGIINATFSTRMGEYVACESTISFGSVSSMVGYFNKYSERDWEGFLTHNLRRDFKSYEYAFIDKIIETGNVIINKKNKYKEYQHHQHFINRDMAQFVEIPTDYRQAMGYVDPFHKRYPTNNGNEQLVDYSHIIQRVDTSSSNKYKTIMTINKRGALSSRFLSSFDDQISCKLGGYKDRHEYYDQFSYSLTLERLQGLRAKMLIVVPQNDPALNVSSNLQALKHLLVENEEKNGFINNLAIWVPRFGGHIASFRNWSDNFSYIAEISHQFHTAVTEYRSKL